MDWFVVTHDGERITLQVSPPNGTAWEESFRFDEIIRVCYEAEGYLGSDRLYIFIRDREASYVVPTAARGGAELFGALIEHHLFDAKLAIEAATSEEGSLYCWPLI
jgi:hypothetical protein